MLKPIKRITTRSSLKTACFISILFIFSCTVNPGSRASSDVNIDDSSVVDDLFSNETELAPLHSFVRDDGVIVTRIGDRGRDRHAKDNGNQDHYDHYLAHYWQYRTARIQLEDHVRNGTSLIKATYVTESELGAREFRLWYWGNTTTGQFHFNPQKEEEKVSQLESGIVYVGKGTWDDNFEKISDQGIQHMYTLDIVNQWQNGGAIQKNLTVGTNMEFEISQFLINPPAGSRLNYYGTSFVYIIGSPGVVPFEWSRGTNKSGGSNDGTPIPVKARLGGGTTLGFNYTNEPAGRFMQMATNLAASNAQPFVEGRRVHHTNFLDGSHDERADNPVWVEQRNKVDNNYINASCAGCHVRNGKALVEDVGSELKKWVFKIAASDGSADSTRGYVLQPQTTSGSSEGTVTLQSWTALGNGLRAPNYSFSSGTPEAFSARIAPQLVGMGLLEAIDEEIVAQWADPNDSNNDGISGRMSKVHDPTVNKIALGRFGYKAGSASLTHHIANALNTDMGVMTSVRPDPDCGPSQSNCGASGSELADKHLAKLVKYVSLLGVGARRDYNNTTGEQIFNDIGCASCHISTPVTTSKHHPLAELREQVIYPYTDLLLHDMGDGLADNLGEGLASGREWRTAPLWGLGHAESVMLGDAKGNDTVSLARRSDDNTRIGYLHDGRARTIEEAILWHGGEALNSKNDYENLSTPDKQAILNFLKSL